MSLLAIVQAEEAAESLFQQAQIERKQALDAAMQRQREALSVLTLKQTPAVVKKKSVNLTTIRAHAKKNFSKAVKKILEEVHALA